MSDNLKSLDRTIDEIVAELNAEIERTSRTRKQKRLNPYVLHLIKVLLPRGDAGLRRGDAIERVWSLRQPAGLPMPRKFEETVQSVFNQHNAQSSAFRGKIPDDDLFYPPGGKGSGKWAVRGENAELWVRRRPLGSL